MDSSGFEVTNLTLEDMARCGAALRGMGDGAASMEAAADRIVRFLDDHLRDSALDAGAGAQVRL